MRHNNNKAILFLFVLVLCCALWGVTAKNPAQGDILVVGATGSTGLRALQGLLDVGFKPIQIRLLTRNARSQKCKALRKAGFRIVEADLEDLPSLSNKKVTKGCIACYIHSTSSDTPQLDTGEVERAKNLATVMGDEIRDVVYNSAAAHAGHGVKRIQQKHDVEEVFKNLVIKAHEKVADSGNKKGSKQLAFTSLRANIFMEELWKHYTRPSILNGTYPLPVRSGRKLYLVSVRDMGRLAGRIFQATGRSNGSGPENLIRTINVAGDYLSAKEIADAFAAAQGSSCRHYNPRMMKWKSYFYFPELYEQIVFLQTFSVKTDIDELRKQFPATLTSFEEFLDETGWSETEKSYSDFSDVNLLEIPKLH